LSRDAFAARTVGARDQTLTAVPVANFVDNFSQSLAPGWFWVREDPSAWSLTERAGYLRIHTQTGSLDSTGQANNILLRPAPGGQFELSTRLQINATQDYREAGLLLYADDDNYIKLSRLHAEADPYGGSVYLFIRETDGEHDNPQFTSLTTVVAELRILVGQGWVSGEYRSPAGTWVQIGQYQLTPGTTYANVGVAAHHGIGIGAEASVPADFDFVRLTERRAYYLPNLLK
jgi:beta-xylosidase